MKEYKINANENSTENSSESTAKKKRWEYAWNNGWWMRIHEKGRKQSQTKKA